MNFQEMVHSRLIPGNFFFLNTGIEFLVIKPHFDYIFQSLVKFSENRTIEAPTFEWFKILWNKLNQRDINLIQPLTLSVPKRIHARRASVMIPSSSNRFEPMPNYNYRSQTFLPDRMVQHMHSQQPPPPSPEAISFQPYQQQLHQQQNLVKTFSVFNPIIQETVEHPILPQQQQQLNQQHQQETQ